MKTLYEGPFREILFADLTHGTLVVPTDVIIVPPHSHPLGIALPRRIYGEQGELFQGEQSLGTIQGLRLKPLFPADSPFKISKRLSIGTPLCFELRSSQPLPAKWIAQALFLYRFENLCSVHYGFFQDIAPTFVRIYPRQSVQQLPLQLKQFRIAVGEFHRQQSDRNRRAVVQEA